MIEVTTMKTQGNIRLIPVVPFFWGECAYIGRLERCGTTKVSPSSPVNKPQRLVHTLLWGDLKVGNQNLYDNVGQSTQLNWRLPMWSRSFYTTMIELLGWPLPSRVTKKPKSNKFHNKMMGQTNFLWWDYKSRSPPSIPERTSRLREWICSSNG
jgi:hypothetical protein